jgi:uncharacterized membrane protein YjgN (DUF898 family)
MNNRYLLALAVLIVVAWMVYRAERYQSGRNEYRYGFVDTNPARRVSDAFDSPNISNPYEGLPLP